MKNNPGWIILNKLLYKLQESMMKKKYHPMNKIFTFQGDIDRMKLNYLIYLENEVGTEINTSFFRPKSKELLNILFEKERLIL